jgi:hypothetical protein
MSAVIENPKRVSREKERIVGQRKSANTRIICDMIRLQIRLRAVQTRLQASPKSKVAWA